MGPESQPPPYDPAAPVAPPAAPAASPFAPPPEYFAGEHLTAPTWFTPDSFTPPAPVPPTYAAPPTSPITSAAPTPPLPSAYASPAPAAHLPPPPHDWQGPAAASLPPPPAAPYSEYVAPPSSNPYRDARRRIADEKLYRSPRSRSGTGGFVMGVALILIGLVITVVTYTRAGANPNGGTYYVAYGPIIVGFFRIVKSMIDH